MLKNKWLDPKYESAFSGVNKIYDSYAGEKSVKEIERELAEVKTYTLHKEKKKVKNFNPFFIYKKHQQWQSDICYLPNSPDENEGNKYILCVLEVFSRKLFIEVIKNKNAKTVLDAFSRLHKLIKSSPDVLYVDKGGEYTNYQFKNYCKKNKIKLIFTVNETKAPHVERAQRSLQNILYKILEERQTKKYSVILQQALNIYNNRKNRITGFSPNNAYKDENSTEVLQNLEKQYSKKITEGKKPKFKIGDKVRISLKKRTFERGYSPKFSEEVFKIKKFLLNLPQPRYIIETYDKSETIDGSFYERELTLATHQEFKIEKILKKRRRSGKLEYFVKWLGFPDNQNSWVGEDQVTRIK